jgi:hypothetical protein
MKYLNIVLLLILFAPMQSSEAQTSKQTNSKTAKCLSYEPEKVSLRGQLLRKTLVNASNQKETIWTIKLDAPVCINADAENEMNVKQNRVTDVQLVLTTEMFKKYRAQLNKKIEASGTLFGGHTQHHFTDVLMIVEEIKAR